MVYSSKYKGGKYSGVKSMPRMLLPEKDKDVKWVESMIDYIVGYLTDSSGSLTLNRYKDIRNYNMYNGQIHLNDYEYLTEQYGTTYPARLVNYPIIQPKIDLLLGEELRRPLDSKVSTINKEAVNRKEDYKVMLEMNKLLRTIHEEIKGETGFDIEMEGDQIDIPEDIDKYMRYNYKEAVEEAAQDGLEYLLNEQGLKEVFKNGFRDLLVTGKEFYKCEIVNKNPTARRVDPRSIVYDVNDESEFLDQAQWIGEERFLTPNEILDEYRFDLDKDQVAEIVELSQVGSYEQINKYNTNMFNWIEWEKGAGVRVRVVTVEFKALREVRYKVSPNKHNPDEPFRKILPESYKAKPKDEIESVYIDDVWEGTKIGGVVVTRARRRPNQVRSIDDAGHTPLSYVGCIRNNQSGTPISLVDVMRNVQMLYNIVMYHIELTLARAGGKSVVYDVSQMPSNIGMDMQTVLYHIKNDGIIPINSRDEGGQTASFNQFSQVDFTLSNSVQQLVNLKLMLEETAGQMSGVSRQREGAVGQYEYVGNVQRSVVQSATITESWFHIHNEVKKSALARLCNLMKLAWQGGKKAASILGDGSYSIINIMPDIALQDFGVYVGDSGKDDSMRQSIQQLSQAALQSGSISLLDVIKVLKADTFTEAETVLEQGMDAMRQMQEQQQQAQQQAAQAQAEQGSADTQAKLELEKLKGDNDARVAEINANSRVKSAEITAEASRDIADAKNATELDKRVLDASARDGQAVSPDNPRPDPQADTLGKEAATEMLEK